MKTLISHIRRVLPVIFIVLFLTLVSAGQIRDIQVKDTETSASGPYTINIGALGAKNLFRIRANNAPKQIWTNFYAGTGGFNHPSNQGNFDVFIGLNAGISNTFGSNNSFFGANAGKSNLRGEADTFIVFGAGESNTEGSSNSFLGFKAGNANTRGKFNSFIGSQAGMSNSTGSFNSFIGSQAGMSNTEGNSNVFLGFSAGSSNTTGTFNLSEPMPALSTHWETATHFSVMSPAHITGAGAITRFSAIKRALTIRGEPAIHSSAHMRVTAMRLRYKKNVTPFSSGLSLLQRLRPIRFEWKEGGMKDVGFGAEDVAAIEPLLATYNENGEVEGVKYDRLTTVLVNAVKEQQVQIEAQQKQIDALKKLLCGRDPAAEICKQ